MTHASRLADPNRCDRAMVGNTIGQANAVSDTVLDLRMCQLQGKNLQGLTLSGALLVHADLCAISSPLMLRPSSECVLP